MVLCSSYQQGQSSPAGTEDRQMTKSQYNKLHRLTGSTETLQNALPQGAVKDAIAKAKDAFIAAIRAADAEATS
jgi:hypothetical protein